MLPWQAHGTFIGRCPDAAKRGRTMSIGGRPSKPPILTPEYVEALTAAKGETFTFRGWKWLVVLAVAIGLLLFILIGPLFLP